MVDVTHDRNDRRARLKQLFGLLDRGLGLNDHFLNLVDACAFFTFFTFKAEAMFFTNLRGNLRLNRLIGRNENFQVDQILHQQKGLEAHAIGEFCDDDRRLDADELVVFTAGDRLGICGDWCWRGSYSCDVWQDGGNVGQGRKRRQCKIRVFFVENFGNGRNDGLARAFCLANSASLLFAAIAENIERGLFHGSGRRSRSHGGLGGSSLSLPFTARGFWLVVEEVQHFFLWLFAFAIGWHQWLWRRFGGRIRRRGEIKRKGIIMRW